MTNSSPQTPPDGSSESNSRPGIRRKVLDEWLAVIVTFSVIGAIFFWSFGHKSTGIKSAFSTREGGLFSFLEDTESADDTRLTLERDSDVTIEEEFTASSGLGKGKAPSSSLPPISFETGKSRDARSDSSIKKLLPLTIAAPSLSGVIIPEPELETPVAEETAPTTEETAPPTPVAEETAPTTEETAPTNSKLAFRDVPEEHWAYRFIQPLGEDNFIIGTSNKNFEPDKLITRAGMATLVSHAFRDNPETLPTKNFTDISPDNQIASDIDKAVKIGFMKGYSDKEFRPEQEIPRYQVWVTLATGLKLTPNGRPDSILSRFSDRNQIPDWAKAQVAAAIESDLVVHRPGFDFDSLQANEPATRAEVAAMIYQTLVQSQQLKPIKSTYILPPKSQ